VGCKVLNRAAAGLHHRLLRPFGDRRGRQHDVAAKRAQEEVRAVIKLALDQRRGARRIAGIVEQFELDLVLLAGDLDAAQHVVDVARGGDVAVIDVEPGLRRGAAERHRAAEHQRLAGLRLRRPNRRRREGHGPHSFQQNVATSHACLACL
jgi:hypothetical protein